MVAAAVVDKRSARRKLWTYGALGRGVLPSRDRTRAGSHAAANRGKPAPLRSGLCLVSRFGSPAERGGFSVNLLKRAFYQSFVLAIRAYQRVFLDFHVWGSEHIPAGPKIFAINHISVLDGLYLLPILPMATHFVIGPPFTFAPLRLLLQTYGHINALPNRRAGVVDESVGWLRRGESILIAPEGDHQEPPTLGRFYPGVARIYRRCPVPIVPIALCAPKRYLREYPFPTMIDGHVHTCVAALRGPFLVNIGEPMMPELPEEGDEKVTEKLVLHSVRDRIADLVDDARCSKYWSGIDV